MRKIMVFAFAVFVILLYVFITEPDFVYGEPRIEDQGNTGMCGVYATCNAIEDQMQKQGIKTPENGFSKQWLWEKCGEYESLDDGITESTALNIAYTYGLCPADDYCTDPAITSKAAAKYKITTYSAITIKDIKQSLTCGHNVLIGTLLDRENWSDGIIGLADGTAKEGHETFLIGFEEINPQCDLRKYYVGVNSWGDKWGFSGLYYMDYNFLYMGLIDAYVFDVK